MRYGVDLPDGSFENGFKRLLWWLLVATRGGEMRLKIVELLENEPSNINRISKVLGVNYRTIEHHIKVLEDNHLIIPEGQKYGKVYFLSPSLIRNKWLIGEILKKRER